MSWTNPVTWLASQIVTAAQLNTQLRDNMNELRGGGIAIPDQEVNDFIHAASATQLGRVGVAGPGGSGRVPTFIAPGWELRTMYPVGSIYLNASESTNPATLFGFGTWVAFGTGRVLVGIDAAQTEFDTLGETGGAKTHTLTTGEIPAHTHTTNVFTQSGGGASPTLTTGTPSAEITSDANVGGGGAHNNLQPFIVVHMWVRTV